MKRILSFKWITILLFFIFVTTPPVSYAQEDELEADWSEDALDESPIDDAPAAPAAPATPSKAPAPPQKQTAVSPATAPAPAAVTAPTAPVATKPPPPPPPAPPAVKPQPTVIPVAPPASTYNVGSKVQRAGPPLILISRPVFAPYSNEEKTMFISAAAEAYFHFKLGALPGVQVIPTERIANTIQYFRDFTRRISRTSYIESAKKIGATYLFYQEYEPKGKSVKFAIELYSIKDNKKISGSTAEIALADFENGLFDFVNEVAGAMIGAIPKETQEFLASPVLGTNVRQIELLGNAIVSLGENSQKSAEKASPEFEKLAKDRAMLLAKYVGAHTLALATQYDNAIALQQQLITSFGGQYPALSLQIAEYYKMKGAYDDAHQAVQEASGEPSLKLQSRIVKAHIYEAEGKLDQAKREYESVLSEGSDDGEILFQLALVSIGLNNLSQSERYLEKAAAAGRELDRGDYYDLGIRYAALGSANELAIKAFKSCLGLQQENEAAWQKLAEIYASSGREGEAAECYVNLFQINNETYKDYLLKAGTMFEGAGKPNEAKDAYSLFIARRYTNPEVSVRLAKLEMQGGNCPKAIELVDNLDTLGEFGPDIVAINTQCGKQERRVVIPTGTGRNKEWKAVFFWRVASGVIAAAGVGAGFLIDNQIKVTQKEYSAYRHDDPSKPMEIKKLEVTELHNKLDGLKRNRNLCYAGAGIGGISFAASIVLPIVLHK